MQSITPHQDIQSLTLDAPVSVVTLLEDRALVQRKGKANLTSGLWRITVENVAPVLSDKSLRAEFAENYNNAKINDVRVRRQMLVKDEERPEDIQPLYNELRSHQDRLAIISEDSHHQKYSFKQVNTILSKALQELPIDAVWGQIDPKTWREQLQTLFKQLRELRTEILSSGEHQAQLRRQIDDITTHLQSLSRPDTIYTAKIESDVMISEAGDYEITFDYVVPNALWRPWHQARLLVPTNASSSPATLSFRMDGCVWQNTGEDWTNVDLVFSTARASLGTEPPLLTDDKLNVKEKSKQIILETRNQQIQTTGLGTGVTTPQRETTNSVNLPGVDDGGEVRTLRPNQKATIPSDGRPYRVPILSFESKAEIEYILMPELSCQVVLKSQQTNSSTCPILAGPVDLVRSSEFVGKTAIGFIAPGEKFALGWGSDEAMRVQRTQTKKQEKDHLTQWKRVITQTQLFLSNIAAEPREITITERVPVSELEQVKVKVLTKKTTNGIQADDDGFCTWKLTLAPYSQHKVTLVYQVATSPEVKGAL